MNALTISADKLSFLDGPTPFIWRGTLDWPLYGRFLNEGATVASSIVTDRRAVGANTICVGAQLSWWPGLNPTNPLWWDQWRPFAQLCADQQMRLCIVVFCDTKTYPLPYQAHGQHP